MLSQPRIDAHVATSRAAHALERAVFTLPPEELPAELRVLRVAYEKAKKFEDSLNPLMHD